MAETRTEPLAIGTVVLMDGKHPWKITEVVWSGGERHYLLTSTEAKWAHARMPAADVERNHIIAPTARLAGQESGE